MQREFIYKGSYTNVLFKIDCRDGEMIFEYSSDFYNPKRNWYKVRYAGKEVAFRERDVQPNVIKGFSRA